MPGGNGELWYVQHGQSEAIGPVETDLLEKGIASGRVPLAARVCPVGGTTWLLVATHPAFAQAIRTLRPGGKEPDDLDFGDEVKTLVAQSPLDVFSGRNHRPPPPPPVGAAQPPVAPWGPRPPMVAPVKPRETSAAMVIGLALGLGLVLVVVATVIILFVERLQPGR